MAGPDRGREGSLVIGFALLGIVWAGIAVAWYLMGGTGL